MATVQSRCVVASTDQHRTPVNIGVKAITVTGPHYQAAAANGVLQRLGAAISPLAAARSSCCNCYRSASSSTITLYNYVHLCQRRLRNLGRLCAISVCGAGGHARCVQVASAAWPAGWALVPAGSEQVMLAAVLDCACMTGLVPQARCHKPDGAVPARCAWQPLRQQQLCELGSAKNERVVMMNRLHGLHR